MASSSTAAETAIDPDISIIKEATYEACLEVIANDPEYVFRQETILDLDTIPDNDVSIQVKVVNKLIDEKLFKVVVDGLGVGWRLRNREDAAKYRGLTAEQVIVYSLIDEAGSEGIWSKTIKAKSNLHDTVFRGAIKVLEGKSMIQDMKSVEHPTRKMYIKAGWRPSERATGGAWYTDNELDEAFIEHLHIVLYNQILKRSFYQGHSSSGSVSTSGSKSKQPKKTKEKQSVEEIKSLRDKALGGGSMGKAGNVLGKAEQERARKLREYDSLLPMPPGYQKYPTCDDLTVIVYEMGYFTTVLTASDIKQALDLLVYDDKITKVKTTKGIGYKAIRKSFREASEGFPNSALTDGPCGRCPVFDLCEEGGPVAPSNCEYFNEWLSI
ncbi:hypothetical protein B7494_g4205 [Chlorociboria aeruginascens]|nr:hypothetical protein B7494_g4205 [Chlorociboria aeruginascens]